MKYDELFDNMGILNFQKCIKELYPSCVKEKWLSCYDHIYVDINYALHYCSHGVESIDEIIERLIKFINNILQTTPPNKSLVFGSDGSAPLSKLILQRKRRLGASKKENINIETSTLIFTPGTQFMDSLEEKLNDYFKFIENIYCIKVEYIKDKYGEAEIKLKNKIMKNINLNKDDTHMIVTSDSDVIVMLASLTQFVNVFVFFRMNRNDICISMGKLLDLHTTRVGMTKNPGLDFMAISLMLGNDYIPKVSFVDFHKLWDSYKKIAETDKNGLILDENLNINKNFLVGLLDNVLLNTRPCYIKKYTYDNNECNYSNYMDGYTWCLHLYNDADCKRYDYMYNDSAIKPHPFGLVLNIHHNSSLLYIDKKIYEPIDPILYAILILPKSSIDLIDKKYHDLINSHEILHEEECCSKCKKYETKIKNIKKIKSDSNKSELQNLTRKFKQHKENHKNITTDVINNIKNSFNVYFS
jgi:hypothetical protein